MKTIAIEGQLRSESGKKAARQTRSEGKVPGVIYGGAETISFAATQKSLKPFIYTPEFQKAEVTVGGKSYICILKDLQFNKTTDELMHIDLLELVDNKKVLASIPLKFTGNSAGVKNGGRFNVKIKSVKVKCLPKDLRENLEVDITDLEIGKNLRIEDIKYEGIETMQSPRIPIASVETTRALKQAATDEAKKK